MEYIRIEDGIIAAHVCGDRPGDDWIEIAGEFWGAVGEPVAWYDENLNRLDDITLYETGRRPLPEGMRLNDGHTGLVEMDDEEKVIAGLKPVPFGMRVDGGRLVSKTEREMWLDGDISTEEYAAMKRGGGVTAGCHPRTSTSCRTSPYRMATGRRYAGTGSSSGTSPQTHHGQTWRYHQCRREHRWPLHRQPPRTSRSCWFRHGVQGHAAVCC